MSFYCGDSDVVIADILAEFIRRTAVFQRHPNRRGGYAVRRGHKSVGNAVTPCVFNRFLAELVIADSRNHHRFAAELCEMRREIERCAADTAVVAEHIKSISPKQSADGLLIMITPQFSTVRCDSPLMDARHQS